MYIYIYVCTFMCRRGICAIYNGLHGSKLGGKVAPRLRVFKSGFPATTSHAATQRMARLKGPVGALKGFLLRPVQGEHVCVHLYINSRVYAYIYTYVTSCHVMSCPVLSCHVMSRNDLSCPVMLFHVLSGLVMSCHVMSFLDSL